VGIASGGSSAGKAIWQKASLGGGFPWQLPNRYLENSPIYAFDKITDPVLIGDDGKTAVFWTPMVAVRRASREAH
jgi:hypothetical protein